MDDGTGGISDNLNSAVRYWGLIPNISEVLGIEDQKGEALWMAFICKWGIMDKVFIRWGIMDTVYLLGEALGIDTQHKWGIGDWRSERWGVMDGVYL